MIKVDTVRLVDNDLYGNLHTVSKRKLFQFKQPLQFEDLDIRSVVLIYAT